MKLPTPPGPFQPGFWDSPLRGPWMTSILGLLLLLLMGITSATGLLSHAAYNPSLGMNAVVPENADLPLTFNWPTSPAWLYLVNQGLHVTTGFAVIPILFAKLWSVMPRLFQFPPVRTPAEGIERASIGLFVASSVFLLATGICNVFYYYPFDFNFVVAHYYGAVIFIASMLVHLVIKLPTVFRAMREHGLRPLGESLAETRSEPLDHAGLVARTPLDPTMSRRGLLAFAGGGSVLLTVGIAGQTVGGFTRPLAFLAPRSQDLGSGPNAFQVNKTFKASGIEINAVRSEYRLDLKLGDRVVESFSRAELLAMPQHTERLPIACVEGWSSTQDWTGVRLADLARLAGAENMDEVFVESLQPRGVLREATLSQKQFLAKRSLLALKVNGADLSLDHGFPARVIVPALPGVHNTKWVSIMTFRGSTA